MPPVNKIIKNIIINDIYPEILSKYIYSFTIVDINFIRNI